MRIQMLSSAITLSAALTVSIGASNAITGHTGTNIQLTRSSSITSPDNGTIQPNEAARLAKQASFGPSSELISDILSKETISTWLDSQFNLSDSTYTDISMKPVPGYGCTAYSGADLDNCWRDNYSPTPVQMRFYSNAVEKRDQLRQRVAFALSQILVTSDVEVHTSAGLAGYNQILLDNSFGNYRTILKLISQNPYMGDYLDMADSKKDQPNENFSRELMQLFSLGTTLLNPDGTQQVDSNGGSVPAYSNTDVKEIARALTGWTWGRLNGAPFSDYVNRDWVSPMVKYPAWFDDGSKTFLGKTVPAGSTQESNVDAVVDAVFNHPNTGPFICKRLIQQLTIANPTPAYVGRVAAAFADNGAGVRGDMKAVIRAIYLDSEARGASQLPGKIKEPVLLATSLARAIGYKTDGYAFLTRDAGMGQQPFRAPSVFNFYPYDFPLPNGAGLVSPSTKLMNTATMVARHNLTYDWTINGDVGRPEFLPQAVFKGTIGTVPNWAPWEANGADDGKTVDQINLLLLNGTMTSAQRQSLLNAMAQIKSTDSATQARKRAQTALYIVASSPLFQVDR